MPSKVRTQRRIPGYRRKPVGTSVEAQIERWLRQEMARWHVSRSFVIARAIAFTANIKLDDDYTKPMLVRRSTITYRKRA